jgi:hypothetical protein
VGFKCRQLPAMPILANRKFYRHRDPFIPRRFQEKEAYGAKQTQRKTEWDGKGYKSRGEGPEGPMIET